MDKLTIAQALLSLAYNIYERERKVSGGKIPTWEEISDKNKVVAIKIENEERRIAELLADIDSKLKDG